MRRQRTELLRTGAYPWSRGQRRGGTGQTLLTLLLALLLAAQHASTLRILASEGGAENIIKIFYII